MDLREKLKEDMGPATWSDLKMFVKRGTLIYISEDLDLLDIGLKVASDDSKSIAELINAKKIVNADMNKLEELKEKEMICLIVDPFVLIQISKENN